MLIFRKKSQPLFPKKVIFIPFFLMILAIHPFPSEGSENNLADKITIQGETLSGRVIGLNSSGIEFSTNYGEGELLIPYNRIENIISEKSYYIIFGDKKNTQGRLLGFEDGKLLVGSDRESSMYVPVDEILVGISKEEYDKSFLTRMLTHFRPLQGSVDVGFKFEEGAVNKRKIEFGTNIQRRTKPTRFVFDFYYAIETQSKKENEDITTKDELNTFVLGEYDISDRFFLFARPAFEFDKPRNIDFRSYPAAGIGYRLVENLSKGTLLQIPLGFGYVSADYDEFGVESYTSSYIGLEGRYNFGNGILLSINLFHMPGLSNPSEDRLFRMNVDLTVPLFDPIALKLMLRDVNDNNPSPEVGDNKFTTSLALSLQF